MEKLNSIRNILEELVSQGWFGKTPQGEFFDQKEDVDKALNHTLSLIRIEIEKCAGEEKLTYEHREVKIGKGFVKETDSRYNAGYNDALADFKKRIEEVF